MAHQMKTSLTVSIFLLFVIYIELCQSRVEWNALKLRFKLFQNFPKTESDAVKEGYNKIYECDKNPYFRGIQYMKDEDPQVVLLFDVNGYIAGIQSGIPNNLYNGYPHLNLQPPFIQDGDLFKLTAYFTDPSTICRRGRSEQRIRLHGTVEYLLIQNGTRPEVDLIEIALEESKTSWVKGRCFPGMGFHYFYNIYYDMNCADFFPVAMLYYHGELKGFVWSYDAVLNSTIIPYEHPEPSFAEELMYEVPLCLKHMYRSTLHIYFEENPESYDCVHFEKKSTCDTSSSSVAGISYELIIMLMIVFVHG